MKYFANKCKRGAYSSRVGYILYVYSGVYSICLSSITFIMKIENPKNMEMKSSTKHTKATANAACARKNEQARGRQTRSTIIYFHIIRRSSSIITTRERACAFVFSSYCMS